MGKGQRNRDRRRNQPPAPPQPSHPWSQPPPGAVVLRGGTQSAYDRAADFFQQHHMECRATYLDDYLFGGAKTVVDDVLPDGTLVGTEPAKVPPVVLFEPSQAMVLEDTKTGTVQDSLTTSIIAAGFRRIPRGILANFPAQGWGLYRTETGLMLRDSFGGIWAESVIDLDPAWEAEATRQGWVTVFVGPYMGIRVPPGKTEKTYTFEQRRQEFRFGRQEGLCAGAQVRWHPEPADETTTWVLLPPGSPFGPLPFAYVPQYHFTTVGGPEAFGFVPTPELLSEVPTAIGLVADAAPGDFDLYQPHLDNAIGFVGGYRALGGATDPFYTSWRQAVLDNGRALIITGHQEFPAGPQYLHHDPHDLVKQARQVVRSSYAAVVPLTDIPRSPRPPY